MLMFGAEFCSDPTIVGISLVEMDVVGTWVEVSELVLLSWLGIETLSHV